jgi:hypothetical protein
MRLKKILAALATPLLLAGLVGLPGANAGPSQGGFSTDNVEYVDFFPFEVGTATGARVIGKYMYITSWKSFSIYDVSDPVAPVRMATIPFGFKFENEDVATNGKIMIFSETTPQSNLHIYDVEDKSNPVLITTVAGAGNHTTSCILKCKWLYGSSGVITDIRNPEKPKVMKQNWIEMTGLKGGAHDVEEFKNGFILTSPISDALQIIDVRNPIKPKVLARGANPDPAGFLFHSGAWPNNGKDKILLMQGEQNAQTRCDDHTGPFMTFTTKNWKKTKTVVLADTWRAKNGTYTDGSPAVNGLGCSAHWFQAHPTFKNGGLVAMGYYEHGTRFFDVNGKGKIKEVGWFIPHAGSTSAAYWLTKKIVYAVDYTRGIDILRYTGKF